VGTPDPDPGLGTGRLRVVRRITRSPEATRILAETLAKGLEAGDCLLLLGTLGAGKTCFVQGLARGLGVSPDHRVTSQTFTLFGVYPGRIPLYHFDAYRVRDPQELLRWGDEALLGEEGVAVVEWGAGLKRRLPGPILCVRFSILSNQDRLIRFYGPWSRFEAVLLNIHGE